MAVTIPFSNCLLLGIRVIQSQCWFSLIRWAENYIGSTAALWKFGDLYSTTKSPFQKLEPRLPHK